jgi:hypothetical protein
MADSRQCAQHDYLTRHDAQAIVFTARIGSVTRLQSAKGGTWLIADSSI